jgi:hypothetical protein
MKYLFLFILFLAMIPACKQDNLVLPDTGRKIVINGFISSDSLLNVRISRSAYISETGPAADTNLSSLYNAQVYIYQNTTKIDSLYYKRLINPNGSSSFGSNTWFHFGNYKSKNVFPLPGSEYKIVVKAPGLPDASASTTIPNLVKIDSVDSSRFITSEYPDMPYKVCMKFDIKFTDPGNETNYYLFNIWKTPSIDITRNLLFYCNDPIVEERIRYFHNYEEAFIEQFYGVAFTDKLINGQKSSLTVSVLGLDIGKPFYENGDEIRNNHKKTIYFRLYSVTKECYSYIRSLNLYDQNYANPLANPVTVYSNIIGGYGIFAGAAVASDSIVFNY